MAPCRVVSSCASKSSLSLNTRPLPIALFAMSSNTAKAAIVFNGMHCTTLHQLFCLPQSSSDEEEDCIEKCVGQYRAKPTIDIENRPQQWWSKHEGTHSDISETPPPLQLLPLYCFHCPAVSPPLQNLPPPGLQSQATPPPLWQLPPPSIPEPSYTSISAAASTTRPVESSCTSTSAAASTTKHPEHSCTSTSAAATTS